MLPTLIELLRHRAETQPTRRAYTFLVDGEKEEATIDYGELDRRARSIGAFLQSQGASGERALLLYPPGLDFIAGFFGTLYAGAIGVPAYPPRPNKSLIRLRHIVAQTRAKFALTTSSVMARMSGGLLQSADLQHMRWITTDTVPTSHAQDWTKSIVRKDEIAVIQYSSGSTAAPKGVLLSHANIAHNERTIHDAMQQTPDTICVSWLPVYHDMGLIGSLIQPMYGGYPLFFMSPVAFLQKPIRWLRAISRHRATTAGAPNFAYDMCVRRTTPEERETLALDSWRVAFNGSEPVRWRTMESFATAFVGCGFRMTSFYPCYGLAEAALFVTGGSVGVGPVRGRFDQAELERHRVVVTESEAAPARELVGCGRPLGNQAVVIVDPDTGLECPSGQVGEVWVSGPNVALGYWNRPDLTAENFAQRLSDVDGRRFLRTGDLGFLHGGELFITGRLKDLIIIRGQKYSPQEIEWAAEQSHPAFRRGSNAAFTVDQNDEPRLVIVQEVERGTTSDVAEMEGAIRQAVCEAHDLQVHDVRFIPEGTIPKTTSGKTQRQACKAGFVTWNARSARHTQ